MTAPLIDSPSCDEARRAQLKRETAEHSKYWIAIPHTALDPGKHGQIVFDICRHPELHHYTSFCGLQGIISSDSMWATNFQSLNDTTEVFYLKSYLEYLLTQSIKDYIGKSRRELARFVKAHPGSLDGRELELNIARNRGPRHYSRALAQWFVGYQYRALRGGMGPSGVTEFEPFIVSFCSHRSDTQYEQNNGFLSQWRGYGYANGVAIVFDTDKLRNWAQSEYQQYDYGIMHMGQVAYNEGIDVLPQQFSDLLPTFVAWALGIISKTDESLLIAEAAVRQFVTNTCLYKHRAFREEREVRIVASPMPDVAALYDDEARMGIVRPHSKFWKTVRIKKDIGVHDGKRYITLDAGKKLKLRETIKRVIVGPCRDQPGLAQRTRTLLGPDIHVVCSETPLLR